MVTKTNFHMLRELDFKPAEFGVLSNAEVRQLREHFQISERSNVELQNLRDFVVMYFSEKMDAEKKKDSNDKYLEVYDLMSGIVGVIDQEKWNRGMEV